jgi:hypothetical protein
VTAEADPGADVLSRYYEASGGLEQLNGVQGLSVTAQLEAYEYQFTVHLHADGRFRIDRPDRVTVFDGNRYWETAYGLVGELPEDQREDYRRYSLRETFFHGLIGEDGKPPSVEYDGKETKHGVTYELLTSKTGEGEERTYYLNAETGLVDKMVEIVPDEDYRELKNIHRYSNYAQFGDINIFTRSEAVCVTNGEDILPASNFTDIEVKEAFEEGFFAKPESEVSAATFADGALIGEVIGLSGRGSLITNISRADFAQLGVEDGGTIVAVVKGLETSHLFYANLGDAPEIGYGDYCAAFAGGPALWLVKAYVGMTSDHDFVIGDDVRVTKGPEPQEETQE